MPRILTVDDSRAIRTIVSKQVIELGFEVDEAEDGVEGLKKLETGTYALILLDVTMPNMDGPTMLKSMRDAGNKTPVLMLTSESKRSIIGDVMKAGIDDYILKPFKPEELKAKIQKTLKLPMTATTGESATAGGAAESADVLLIDDMENVNKKLRTLINPAVAMQWYGTGSAALAAAQKSAFKMIFVDIDLPDVSSLTLLKQLRTLQAKAKIYALCLRSASDIDAEVKSQGFDGALLKPFELDQLEDILAPVFEGQEAVTAKENVISIASYAGKEDKVEKYFQKIALSIDKPLEYVATACFDEVIVDISKLPVKAERIVRFLNIVQERAKKMALQLRLVGPEETAKLLKSFEETKDITLYSSVDAAKSG